MQVPRRSREVHRKLAKVLRDERAARDMTDLEHVCTVRLPERKYEHTQYMFDCMSNTVNLSLASLAFIGLNVLKTQGEL